MSDEKEGPAFPWPPALTKDGRRAKVPAVGELLVPHLKPVAAEPDATIAPPPEPLELLEWVVPREGGGDPVRVLRGLSLRGLYEGWDDYLPVTLSFHAGLVEDGITLVYAVPVRTDSEASGGAEWSAGEEPEPEPEDAGKVVRCEIARVWLARDRFTMLPANATEDGLRADPQGMGALFMNEVRELLARTFSGATETLAERSIRVLLESVPRTPFPPAP